MNNKLNKCPFCGTQPEIQTVMREGHYYKFIYCPGCELTTKKHKSDEKTEKKLIKYWNYL